MSKPSYSEDISRFVAGLRYSALPQEAVDAAKRHLMDIVGVGLIGSRQDMARRALAGIGALPSAQGEAQVWGSERRLAAPYAALVNGVATHVLDFDDTHTDSIVHGSAIIGPVVLALGEALSASGEDLITAFAAGWEVAARVGLAARGTFHKRGFHTTSIAGIFGGTAAAGTLLGLTAEQMSHAIGMTGSQVSGVSEYLSNGSSSKSFHPGWSAHAAIVAAHLAKAGMTGPMTVFEGRYGLYKTYGLESESDLAQLNADLGMRWEVTRISIKPYACCHFAHAFIDCARAMRAAGIGANDIASLECVVPEIELPLICEPFAQKLRPDTPYAAKFSLPYLVAVGLIDGKCDHATFAPENIRRPDLLSLADRVTYRVARAGETTFPKYFPGWIQGRRVDGTPIEQRLDINYGNPDNPMGDADVEAKFRDNAQGLLHDRQIDAALDILRNFERHKPADLARAIAVSSAPRETRKRA